MCKNGCEVNLVITAAKRRKRVHGSEHVHSLFVTDHGCVHQPEADLSLDLCSCMPLNFNI